MKRVKLILSFFCLKRNIFVKHHQTNESIRDSNYQ